MKVFKGIKYIGSCALILFSVNVLAQTVAVEGELRPRIEYRNGYGKPLTDANDPGIFGIQRSRFSLSFSTAVLKTQFTVQDARTFGETDITSEASSGAAATSVFEAWAELLIMPGGSLKIGRQVLKYDDNRLFSGSAWSNTGSSHDVALFKYNVNDFQAHLGFAYNNNSAVSSETYYTAGMKYRYMGFLWMSKELLPALTLSAIGVDEGLQDAASVTDYGKKVSMNHTYTFGGNLKYGSVSSPLSALATAYFQGGTSNTGSKMRGYMAAVKADYKITTALAANLGFDYFSGDDNSTDGKQSNFKKLYGSDHTFNGYMDYWNTPLTQGLADYYGGLTAKVNKNLSLDAAYHVFATAKDLTSGGAKIGKKLGSELDLTLTYKMNNWTTLQGGWSTYFTNDNTRIAKSLAADAKTGSPQWAYMMLTITPSYLKSVFSSDKK